MHSNIILILTNKTLLKENSSHKLLSIFTNSEFCYLLLKLFVDFDSN